MGQLRCWIARHGGVYLGGISLVFAETEDEAAEIIQGFLSTSDFGAGVGLSEVPVEAGTTLVWNGDY
jgi:hypothetical protein